MNVANTLLLNACFTESYKFLFPVMLEVSFLKLAQYKLQV